MRWKREGEGKEELIRPAKRDLDQMTVTWKEEKGKTVDGRKGEGGNPPFRNKELLS